MRMKRGGTVEEERKRDSLLRTWWTLARRCSKRARKSEGGKLLELGIFTRPRLGQAKHVSSTHPRCPASFDVAATESNRESQDRPSWFFTSLERAFFLFLYKIAAIIIEIIFYSFRMHIRLIKLIRRFLKFSFSLKRKVLSTETRNSC